MRAPTIPTLTLLLILLKTSTAFVLFQHSHAEIDTSTLSLPSPASSTLLPPSPTETNPIDAELKPRQAQVTAPAATLPDNPNQISPITTYQADSVPPGGGPPVRVPIVYTQTFAAVPDQWELAGVGSIGMGSIVGEIGVVKSKRFVPFVVELEPETTLEEAVPVKTVSFSA